MNPETRYARSGDINIAYQVVGEGDHDLVYVPGWVSNVELMWDDPGLARFLRRLSSFSRLITFDKRGTGLSDPVPVGDLPDLDTRIDDIRAVMDAVGSEKATIFGHSEGGNVSVLWAATHPDRTEGLILTGSYVKRVRSDEYPWSPTLEERMAYADSVEKSWGRIDEEDMELKAPSRRGDRAFQEWLGRYMRMSASPSAAAALVRMNTLMDTSSILDTLTVPTLLLYREHDKDVLVEEGEYIATKIPRARFVRLPGGDHLFWAGEVEQMLQEIEEFVTGQRGSATSERRLATVLFTDIVDSTSRASEMGDRVWRDVLERHNQIARREFAKWKGSEVNPAGDGFLSTFDSPTRAIECGLQICRSVDSLGIQVRAGVHTGEVELVGDDIAGLAVHIGARVSAMAAPATLYASSTVRDLLVGSRFEFIDQGARELKGVPGSWHLFQVAA